MVVLCPKSFNKGGTLHWAFLHYYLFRIGEKAYLSNKSWDAFRARITKKYGAEQADLIIAEFRGSFRPEDIRLNEDYQEHEATDYKNEELLTDTRDLIERRGAEIYMFITEEPDKYKDLTGVIPQTLNQWFHSRMNHPTEREMMQDFMEQHARERQG